MDVDPINVDEILSAHKQKFKPIEVLREVQPTYDLGHLLISDLSDIDTARLRREKDNYLLELARDNTQLLINEIWKLPISRVDECIVAQLPKPTTVLPREKPIPKPRPPTKWEEFAKKKGIVKGKRSKFVFDEKTQEYKPRWGYKRVNDPKDQWLMEVPSNADPYEDQFEKHSEERKERIAKNEYQRLKNVAKTTKGGKVKASLPPPEAKKITKHQITQAIGTARKATASAGVFTEKLPSEPNVKNSGKRRKFDPVVGKYAEEKSRAIDILTKIANKKSILDTAKATNKFMADEQHAKTSRVKGKSKQQGKHEQGGKGKKRKSSSHKATPAPKKLMKQRAKKKRK